MSEPNTNTPKEDEIIPQITPTPAVPSMPPSPSEVGKAVAAKQSIKEEIIEAAKPIVAANAATEVIQRVNLLHPEVRPHAFVVMPFGKKKGGDGSLYDFNEIYKVLIKPALEEAGFESFRADEETTSGDILTDMFQELLLADLCLCDLSIDNANVFYEVGIRHAFRKRGVVHIQAGRAYMPFDIFNVRTLPYHITPEGVPDPAFIKSDIQAIARMARDTWASDRESVHSPIFNLLSGLKEPERRMLRTPLATGFWREYNEWKERVTIAQRQKRIGDILLLTEEIQNPLIKEEAIGEAGKALADMERNELALAQYRKGIEVNAGNLVFRREEALHLNRLGRVDEAIVKLESLLTEYPNDWEATAYLARIYKEMWTKSWENIGDKNKRLKSAYDSYHWLIKSANIYLKGFHIDLNNYYPGINAFTLSSIAVHIADKFENKKDPDPDIAEIRRELPNLQSALNFALEVKADEEQVDYWTLISLAELRVLTATNHSSVERAYRKALTASRRQLFNLNSSLKQLEILKALGIRTEFVQTGINTIKEEIARTNGEEGGTKGSRKKQKNNGRAFLFSGYMVDYPGKDRKTFPADKESEIRGDLQKKLESFKLIPDDRAFIGGLSAGSEIIFAEICAELGMKVKVFLPLPEAEYIREFVSPAGDKWVERFYKIRNHPLVEEMYQTENVGRPKKDDDPFERNNRWALYSSLGRGVDKVRLIALWNGQSDHPKDRDARLVRHMIDLTRDLGASIDQVNTSKYLYDFIDSVLERLVFEGTPTTSTVAKGQRSRKAISASKLK
jgi:tetratricopeptide (TPR) repeat protein